MVSWRSMKVVLQLYHSYCRKPVFKAQQIDGLSLTPSQLSVSQFISLPAFLLLQICSLHIYSLTHSLQFISLSLLSPLFSFAFAPLSLGSFIAHIYTHLHCQFITKVEFHPFIFLFFSPPGCHNPLSSPLPPLTQPICLFTFWQTWVSLY